VSPNLSVELQYSSRHLSINTGASTRDRILGTLLVDSSRNARYWSPTFCSICGDEKRDNDDMLGKVSYFLSTRAFGAHHLVAGYDRFNDKIFQNAYASGSDYRIQGTSSIIVGTSVFPQFLPNSTVIMHTPVEQSTLGSDLRMHSVFVNDGWRLNEHLSFNLGVRWDKNQAQDGGGAVVANEGLWSPRVAAIWDPKGDGRWALNASYARYVMPMTSNVAASTTAAGNASTLAWLYRGPAINADQNAATLVTSAEAIERVFQWFDDNGGAEKLEKVGSFLPGVNVRIDTPLKSPNADEFSVGTSRQLGTRGTLRVDGVWRTYHDFYSQRADTITGTTSDVLGNKYDLFLVENTNNVKRQYSGLSMQASYRVTSGLDIGGNYTLSRTWGNFDGETAGGGPSVAQVDAYPEYKRAEWNSPEGDLAADQRHRARFWGTYTAGLPDGAGTLTFGLLQQVGSGVPYGAVAPITAVPFVVPNPGYVTPLAPNSVVDYYFTARDAFRTATSYRTDLSVNYGRRLHAGDAQPELFFHAEVLNVFRDFQLCGCGGTAFSNGGAIDISTIRTSVRTPRTTPTGTYQTFNPYTTVPVRGTHWDLSTVPGQDFGGAVSHLAYTTPRLFRFSVGIRF
jgi:outer membrane receptor protein involved in Fe transport